MADGENAKTVSISHTGKNKEANKSAFNKNGVEWKLGSGKKAIIVKYGEVTEYKNKKGEVIAYLTLTKDGSVKVVAGSKKGKVKLSAKVNGKTYKTTVTIKEK